MNHDNISPELRERAKACKTTEELLALAKEEGIELSDEELNAVSGGMWQSKCEEYKWESCEQDDDGPE